jgi:hypothetical protein
MLQHLQLQNFLKFLRRPGYLWVQLLIMGSFLPGCASSNSLPQGVTQLGPYQVRPAGFVPQPLAEVSADPAGVIAGKGEDLASSMFTQPIDDPLVFSSQANSLIQAVAGPNQTSGAILEGQNYYREAVGTWNNPWQALFALRNNWIR